MIPFIFPCILAINLRLVDPRLMSSLESSTITSVDYIESKVNKASSFPSLEPSNGQSKNPRSVPISIPRVIRSTLPSIVHITLPSVNHTFMPSSKLRTLP